MSAPVIDGKFTPRPMLSKAPSPAEIAAKAYDRAIKVAVTYAEIAEYSDGDGASATAAGLEKHMEQHRAAELSALREEVINPPAIRGKR